MKADIIACYPTTFISKIICWVTSCPISHFALKMSDTLIVEASWFGAKISKLSDYSGKYKVLRCNTLSEEERNKIVAYSINRIGFGYDYLYLVGLGLNFISKSLYLPVRTDWDNSNKDVCIELIIDGYRSVSYNLAGNTPDNEISQYTILDCPLLTEPNV
jgi:hypothetical protein